MTFNPDAPGEMLDRASMVYWELCGPAAYLNWLEKEVSRTRVHLEYKKAVVFSASTASGARDPSPLAITGAASIDPKLVDEMANVLRWYGDRKNYKITPLGDASAVMLDDGSRASVVLNKYDLNRMGT
jgi:hypothetical protein